jgi:hypothetical protein
VDLGRFVQLQRRVYLFGSNARRTADIPVAPRLRFLRTGCKEAIITGLLIAYVRAHLESVSSFHLDIFVRLLSTAINGLHPTVLDPVVVVGDYRV